MDKNPDLRLPTGHEYFISQFDHAATHHRFKELLHYLYFISTGIKHKCAVNGLPPPRKKPFTPRAAQEPPYDPRPPQEPPYTPRPPPAEDRYPSPSHHQGGHFGNPNGFGNHNAPIPFRPLPPSMLYPQY